MTSAGCPGATPAVSRSSTYTVTQEDRGSASLKIGVPGVTGAPGFERATHHVSREGAQDDRVGELLPGHRETCLGLVPRRSRHAELVLSRLQRGAGGGHLVLPRPFERGLEGLGRIALLSRRDVEGLTRPVHLLRRDQLLGEQLLGAAMIALGQVTRGARAVGALPQLLDLGGP